ncbi:MAG: hypothetical protein KKH97_07755 [Proteobacteria bacterium]|nr:hypothetical protein [Pseudomonadota bacterium]
MGKLGKREIIILGVVTIVILYAVFDFLSPKTKSSGIDMVQKNEELNTFVTEMTGSLEKETAKNLGTVIFSRAENDWTRDPFLDAKAFKAWTDSKSIKAKEDESAVTKIEFIYSGYLEVGRKRMAIINGIEYNEGEVLDVKGYMLKSVSPSRVLIENRGIGATVKVPLQE